ncbi:baculoviral IAP repeat-containing protein 3-like [Mizuhopecten yessoensis]|uniref:Baculoviral IAP repeat-containing protein 7-A n=1 Tax=Mizuhopecten yessoensis TaxID=6573 RepID=A0A210PHX6_MIZYE|nr:baculoviral IAP repeat-containing protein 3-like [Mizuhopecten yessoensis]XP_021341279.1 baculoviral IAP repeat-containing protein 3-like [Mizuhopecten yessoensis]OWF36077.1 Baculoviral IAP repeat-containing protein 7-A [Mizuhopecten yessoensis]
MCTGVKMLNDTPLSDSLGGYFERKLDYPQSDNTCFMNFEFLRLDSFQNWPRDNQVFAIRFAAAGLYHVGSGQTVKCFQCDFVKEHWQKGEIPFDEHKKFNPRCPFLDGSCTTNIPIPIFNRALPDRFDKIRHLLDSSQPVARTGSSTSLPEGSRSPLSPNGGDFNRSRSLEPPNDSTRVRKSPSISHSPERFPQRIPSSPEIRANMTDSEQGAASQIPSSSTSFANRRKLDQRSQSVESSFAGPKTEAASATLGHPERPRDTTDLRRMSNPGTRGSPGSGRNSHPESSGSARVSNSRSSGLERVSNPGIAGPSQPDTSVSQRAVLERDPGVLRFERNRLETYRTWPSSSPVTTRDLARSGFYYVGSEDRVQCIYCRGILKGWDPGDVVHIEHRNKFPRCPFILGMDVGNIPYSPNQTSRGVNNTINQNSRFSQQAPSQMEALGINTDRPKHPTYAIEASRLSSFRNWPTYKHQTPEFLSKAGFFYANFGDNVKCFYCDGGLKNWEPGDNPWEEHARWFPKCPFVRSVKGEAYIQSVQDRFNSGTQQSIVNRGRKRRAGQRFPIEEREIKARMELPMVRAVLDTGMNRNVVMQAIRNRMEDIGDDFPNAEALMNAALEINDDPDQFTAVTSRRSGSSSPCNESVETPTEAASKDPSSSKDESISSEKSEDPDLSEEIRTLKDQKTCKICLDEEVGMVFLPCGHLCACVTCAPAVQHCPICRCDIRGTVRTYMS